MMYIKRIARSVGPVFGIMIFKKMFPLWQRLGFHITKNLYYEPVPDTRELKDELWQRYSELVGIDLNEKRQLILLANFVSKYKVEYSSIPLNWAPYFKIYQYYINNGNYESVDGEILYSMIRYFTPKKIIEIGSGFSTYLSAQAVIKNKEEDNGYVCELIAIEPYPNDVIRAGFTGLSKLMPKKVQDVPLSEFDSLQENDILFIDSSHVLKIGSDVQYEYLEILPRLKRGVIVHLHDIFLPSEYPKDWVMKHYRFYNEQYLLQAFLTFNDSFEVLWAGSYMHLRHAGELETAFISYRREERWPGSFWIRKIK